MSIETDITDKIQDILNGITGIKSVHYEKIKMATTDFLDHEIPAAQLWDVGQTMEHQRGRILVNWAMSIELVTKSLFSGEANQSELLDLRRTVQLALWDKANLGIPGVVHLVYNGNITDLHLLDPYFVARIDFSVLFYDNLTGSC